MPNSKLATSSVIHIDRVFDDISTFIIPPVYKVYRGYIVFAFSVCLCVCKLFVHQRFLRNYLT